MHAGRSTPVADNFIQIYSGCHHLYFIHTELGPLQANSDISLSCGCCQLTNSNGNGHWLSRAQHANHVLVDLQDLHGKSAAVRICT